MGCPSFANYRLGCTLILLARAQGTGLNVAPGFSPALLRPAIIRAGAGLKPGATT
jgi:hypothetical protein